MALELVYTSAERGLRAGTSGFCTVAMSRALQPGLVPRLEALGGYRPGPTGDGPVARSFWRIEMSSGVAHVLSIVGPAPPDHTQRTNKIATYLVLGQDELDDAGPAWMLAQPGAVRTAWSGPSTWIEQPARAPGGGPAGLRRATAWEAACGDAGWAGVLASAFLRDQGKPAHVIVPAGVDPLPLVDDAMHLLPPWARWRATFTTYFLQPVAGVQCAWRFCVDGTPGAEQARQSKGLVIDLSHPIGQAPDSRFVRMARTGTDPEGDAEAARQRREREARAAAERARAAQIRVMPDPRGGAAQTSPRAPITTRGLPIELDEPVAPTAAGLSRGIKIGLGVGGGVLLLAIVALILIATAGGQRQGGAKGPLSTATATQVGEQESLAQPAKTPAPKPADGATETTEGAGSGGSSPPTAIAGEQPGGKLEPTKDAHETPAAKPNEPVIAPQPAPAEPNFPASVATSFGKMVREHPTFLVTWPDVAPQFESSKILAPPFVEGVVVDPSAPHSSRALSIGKERPITLVRATGGKSVRMMAVLTNLPPELPSGWLPPNVAKSIKSEDWIRLVTGRLLVEDNGALFQPKMPAAVSVVNEEVIREVIDPALWVEVPGELTKDGTPFRVRAIRPSDSGSGRMVSVDLVGGKLAVELVPDGIDALVRFEPLAFSGETPAALQAQIESALAKSRELDREVEGLKKSIEWWRASMRRNAPIVTQKQLANRESELRAYLQRLNQRELAMLHDSTGKSVGFDRQPVPPDGATQVVLKVSILSVQTWDVALESLRSRLVDEAARLKSQLDGMRQDLKRLQERIATALGTCTLLGDDGYVIAKVSLMPARPQDTTKPGGTP